MKKLGLFILLFSMITTLAFSAPATMYVTVAGATTKTGATWATAMGLAEWVTDMEATPEPGDFYYVEDGTYTLSSSINTGANGSATLPIKIIGVKTGTSAEPPTFSDWSFTTDRPLIAAGTATVLVDAFWHVYNMEMTTSAVNGFDPSTNTVSYNMKITNDSASAGRYAISANSVPSLVLNSELISTNGIAAHCSKCIGNYIHDSVQGTKTVGGQNTYINNIIDTCTIGMAFAGDDNVYVIGNTIYNSTTAFTASDSFAGLFINNIIDTATTGASWTTADQLSTFWDNNVWSNISGSDTSNVTKGNNDVTADITLNAPASGDFRLPSSSAAEGVGFQVNTNVGVVGDYNWNIGVDQTDTQAGGGGTTSYGFSN